MIDKECEKHLLNVISVYEVHNMLGIISRISGVSENVLRLWINGERELEPAKKIRIYKHFKHSSANFVAR